MKRDVAASLEGLASLEAAAGQHARAACLYGAAEALRERLGSPPGPVERPEWERKAGLLRVALGEAALAAAWCAGRELPLEEAVALALDDPGRSR